MAASRHTHDLIGGRYRLDGPIASGGMADVWRATDLQLKRVVAVKLLRAHVANDPTVAERFRREARALARLTHPNIVPVYDCIEEDGQVALVMRLIEGKSLRELLDEAGDAHGPGTLSVYLTVHIGRAIAAALAKAHDENILHRDIKPGNILVMERGEVLLTDFGIAKPLKSSEDDGTDLTRVDIMMGTAKYLSPEQVQGRPLDARADMYSLGLVLYECLAGTVPFKGENDQATAIARLERDPTPLAGYRSDVPSTVINVVHKMLRRKPDNRFTSCNEVAEALENAINHVHDAVTPAEGLSPNASTTYRTRTAPLDPLMRPREPRTSPPLSGVPSRDAEPTPAPRVQRDRTPRGTAQANTSLPRTQRTSTKRNYIPVALLLVVAMGMSFMLWKGLQNTKSDVAPAIVNEIQVGPVSIVGLKSYDPNGDDGVENEALLPALTDGNPATSWTTMCYGNKYFGSKAGLGIVVQLSGIGLGTLSTNFMTAPWSAEVYATTSETIPAAIEDWGLRIGSANSTATGMATVNVDSPARNVLFLLREIGPSTGCSNNNPFRGELSELSFTSTS
jgi:serine/threonine protein kinase